MLGVLLTDPKYQRRAAGGMLTDWRLEIAVELKLPAYLDFPPYGHKVYHCCGFRDVDTTILDKSKYAGEGTLMV